MSEYAATEAPAGGSEYEGQWRLWMWSLSSCVAANLAQERLHAQDGEAQIELCTCGARSSPVGALGAGWATKTRAPNICRKLAWLSGRPKPTQPEGPRVQA